MPRADPSPIRTRVCQSRGSLPPYGKTHHCGSINLNKLRLIKDYGHSENIRVEARRKVCENQFFWATTNDEDGSVEFHSRTPGSEQLCLL